MTNEMRQLGLECMNCLGCELGRNRTNLVFGVGNDRAKIMLIGEGPGEQEERGGRGQERACRQRRTTFRAAV